MKKSHLTLIYSLIVLGATNTLFLKFQNIQIFKQGDNQRFFHPFIQTLTMFLGEMICGIVYLAVKNKQRHTETYGFQKPKAPIHLLLFPAVMDLVASLLSYISLNMVASSVWQISRGGVIITTALFSYLFLKKRFERNAIVGCIIAFLGITGVELITVLSADSSQQDSQILGIVLLLASLLFNGGGLVSEKWIFNKYELNPLKLVFFQGLFGTTIMFILAFAGQYLSCPWDHANCILVDGQYYLQSFSVFFYQMDQNMLVWIFTLCLIVSISISVPIAVTISKLINPLSRSLADVCRTLIIWAVGILITITIGQVNQSYKIQDTNILINILKALCFVILIFGTMLYHDMIPCFNDKMKESLLLSDSDEGNAIDKQTKGVKSSIRTQESLM